MVKASIDTLCYLVSIALLAILLIGCDDAVEVGERARVVEVDSYTMIVDKRNGKDVLVAPHITRYAAVGNTLLGERCEIVMPMQRLAAETEFFIFGEGGLQTFTKESDFKEAAEALRIDTESLKYVTTPRPLEPPPGW